MSMADSYFITSAKLVGKSAWGSLPLTLAAMIKKGTDFMFNTGWFDELRKLTYSVVSRVAPPQGAYVPELNQFSNIVSDYSFLDATYKLIFRLNKLGYRLNPLFKVYEQHICNFPKGTAFKKQINIGFTAGETSNDDFMRIGIGFRISTDERFRRGWEDYTDFYMESQRRKILFDNLFMQLGNYSEPDLVINNSMADGIKRDLSITPPKEFEDTWRFFGTRLMYNNVLDRAILHSMDDVVAKIDSVFKLFKFSNLI